MSFKKHDRTYDVVVYGATGYTGTCISEYIAQSFPTNVKWALAGRSPEKLAKIASEVKKLNPDRLPPAIETASNTNEDLDKLAKKTFLLITAVGPFLEYGEPAFRACAENGTHYVDTTGEVPWVARMLKKYEETAKSTGALMFPQCGVDSAPTDLTAWLLAKTLRTELDARTGEATISTAMEAKPSGGTLHTLLGLFDSVPLGELRESLGPFATSPVPNPNGTRGNMSLVTKLTGVANVPNLGLVTSLPFGAIDAVYVERSWGLLYSLPSRKNEFYGPRFSFHEYAKAGSWLQGITTHLVTTFAAFFLVMLPPARWLTKRLIYQPGQGPDREDTKNDTVEYRGVANPDFGEVGNAGKPKKQAFVRAAFTGGLYPMTALLNCEAARVILEDRAGLDGGGVYTSACLGQTLIDGLHKAGFTFESKLIDA